MRSSDSELKNKTEAIRRSTGALFFDLDGTLLEENDKISKDVRRELERIKALGNKIFVNTGRAKGFLPKGIYGDSIFSGYVCGGAYVEFEGEILFNKIMCPEARKQIINFSQKNDIPLIFEGINENYILTENRREGFVNIPKDMTIEFFCESTEVTPTKATFFKDIKGLDCSEICDARVIKFSSYAEALSLGCNKAAAMKILLEKIGLPIEKAVSFGDSENDSEMLDCSGIAVAMPHSPDSLKKKADIVSDIITALRIIFG